MASLRAAVLAIFVTGVACSSVSTVRVQPESVYVGPHLRPIAVVHAQVTSAYVLFIPIPGGVELDRVEGLGGIAEQDVEGIADVQAEQFCGDEADRRLVCPGGRRRPPGERPCQGPCGWPSPSNRRHRSRSGIG